MVRTVVGIVMVITLQACGQSTSGHLPSAMSSSEGEISLDDFIVTSRVSCRGGSGNRFDVVLEKKTYMFMGIERTNFFMNGRKDHNENRFLSVNMQGPLVRQKHVEGALEKRIIFSRTQDHDSTPRIEITDTDHPSEPGKLAELFEFGRSYGYETKTVVRCWP